MAARLEAEAEPGSVLVSEDVWRQLRRRPEFRFRERGERELRGITEPIRVYEAVQVLEPGTGPPARIPRRGRPWRLVGSRLGLRSAVLGFAALAGVTAMAVWELRPQPARAFPSRGWALIGDFENHTGEATLDDALATALTVALEQSAHVNLASGPRIDGALRLMKRDPQTPISPAVAREIAQREGLDVVMLPSVSRVGKQYLLAVRLEDPETGKRLHTASARAASRDDILRALDRIAIDLREYLGEPENAITRHRKPLELATTSSLPALQQYSLGFQAQRNGRYQEAKRYYESAIHLDSTFARALASLGMLEWEKGNEGRGGAQEYAGFDPERGKQLLSRAIDNLEGVTERERLGILNAYAFAVKGDLDEAIAYEQLRLREYPDSYVSYNNLGRLYYYLGRYEESVEQYKHAVRIYPGLTGALEGIVVTYLYLLGDVDSALVWARKAVATDSTFFKAWDHLGWAYLGHDSLAHAERAFRTAVRLQPDYTIAQFRLGHTQRLLGHPARAVQTFGRILARDSSDRSAHYDIAVAYEAAGERNRAHAHYQQARDALEAQLRASPTAAGFLELATLLTRMGESERARSAEQRGLARLRGSAAPDPGRQWQGLDARGYFELAALRSVQGSPDAAVAALEQARLHGFTNYIWLRMHPDFQSLQGHRAFAAFVRRGLHLDPVATPARPPVERAGAQAA